MQPPTARQLGRLVGRAACLVGLGTVLGLAVNAAHPMRLPLALGEVEGPGIPMWIWESVSVVNVQEARSMWEDGSATFLDARNSQDQWDDAIPGSVPLPFHELSEWYPDFVARTSRSERFVLYCYGSHCGLAMRLAKRMIRDGYEDIVVLRGGADGPTIIPISCRRRQR